MIGPGTGVRVYPACGATERRKGIAPVHQRLPDRSRAHALICFLTPVLWRVVRLRLKSKGAQRKPQNRPRPPRAHPRTHRPYRRPHLQWHQQDNTGTTRRLPLPEPPQTGLKARSRHTNAIPAFILSIASRAGRRTRAADLAVWAEEA